LQAKRAGPESEAECWIIDAGWERLVILRVEGSFTLDDLESLDLPGVKVGYSKSEDPGPCPVALAALYRSEEEGPLGPPRIRNKGLHIKAISLGARQISELDLRESFDVIYSIYLPGPDQHQECTPLRCSGDDLHRVTAARAKALK
jgi:hypothetical protein